MTYATHQDGFHSLSQMPEIPLAGEREPETCPHGEFSAFERQLARVGKEFERYVHQFSESENRSTEFKRAFTSGGGQFARADAVEQTGSDETVFHEVNSSTRVKDEHLKDAGFRNICSEGTGRNVDRLFLVHRNGDYFGWGEVDPSVLLNFTDATAQLGAVEDETVAEIDAALAFPANEIDRNGCTWLEESRAIIATHSRCSILVFRCGQSTASRGWVRKVARTF